MDVSYWQCRPEGDPRKVVPAVAREVGAQAVHVTRESTPFGRRRDAQVERALSHRDIRFISTGTPYAVGPGLVVKQDGAPYQVFTPFRAAWRDHGWPAPAGAPANLAVAHLESDREAWSFVDDALSVEGLPPLPEPGEAAALRKRRKFLDGELAAYDSNRARPDRPGTSQLSPHLKVGAIHPRTLLADLAGRRDRAADTFVSELAWREFYADVLWHNPSSAWRDLKPTLSGLAYDEADDLVEAWRQGRTGYPIVDAAMRQLNGTGYMHNRLRMVTASFLTKDLGIDWRRGERLFADKLIDFDTPGKVTGYPVGKDDRVIMRSSGGGGYGDPLTRPPEAVQADVRAGFVSVARAERDYGVVIDAGTGAIVGMKRPAAVPASS